MTAATDIAEVVARLRNRSLAVCENCGGEGYTDMGRSACAVCFGAGVTTPEMLAALRSPGLDRDGERMRELLLDLRQDMSGAWFAPHEKAAYRASTTTFKKGNPYCDGWDDAFREAERCVDEAIRELPLAHEEKAGC